MIIFSFLADETCKAAFDQQRIFDDPCWFREPSPREYRVQRTPFRSYAISPHAWTEVILNHNSDHIKVSTFVFLCGMGSKMTQKVGHHLCMFHKYLEMIIFDRENKSIWGIILVKSKSFVLFLEETLAWKNNLDFVWPLEAFAS